MGKHARKLRRRSNWRKFKQYTGTALGLAQKALGVANEVKKLVNAEGKYIDNGLGIAVDTPGSATARLLSQCAEGTDPSERVGISIKALNMSFKNYFNLDAGTQHSLIRLTIFKDQTPNGALPTEAALYESPARLASPYNKSNIGTRFRVISDKYYSLNTGDHQILYDSIYKELQQHMKYTGAGGTINECTNDHYFFFVREQVDAGSSVPSTANIDCRISFVDN